MNNDIQTWQQGQFIERPHHKDVPEKWKDDQRRAEVHLVRPGPTENAICHAFDPDLAKWIADRLNLASRLEKDAADEIERLREALEWYGEKARLCRLIHSEGDAGRRALDADGGERARVALGKS